MLLLVTILLVAVGTISLIIGFVQSSLLPIYISIACSVLAAVVLLIFSRMTAKSQQVVTAGGPAPLPSSGPAERDDRTEPVPAFSGSGRLEGSSSGETFAPEDRYGSSSRFGGADDGSDDLDDVRPADADVVDDDFPIERYDSRRVGEILPLLAELDLDELDIVREHEEQGKSRATVLARIDQLIDQLEAEDRQEAASRFDEPSGAPAFAPAPAADEPAPADDDDLEEAPVPVAAAPVPPPTQAVTVAALPEDDGYFPIEDYDDLRASEILPLLPELDDDELVMVQDRERSTAARSSILRRIEALLLDAPEAAAPPPEPEPVAAFAPEPAPREADDVPAKKVPSRRAPAAKKTAAVKAPAKKAAATVPAKKAPVVKKAAAAKAPTRKSAIPAEPATPVKKTPAKAGKAAVAKKAPSDKVASGRAAAATKGGGTASAKAAKVTKATRKTTKG